MCIILCINISYNFTVHCDVAIVHCVRVCVCLFNLLKGSRVVSTSYEIWHDIQWLFKDREIIVSLWCVLTEILIK